MDSTVLTTDPMHHSTENKVWCQQETAVFGTRLSKVFLCAVAVFSLYKNNDTECIQKHYRNGSYHYTYSLYLLLLFKNYCFILSAWMLVKYVYAGGDEGVRSEGTGVRGRWSVWMLRTDSLVQQPVPLPLSHLPSPSFYTLKYLIITTGRLNEI